MFNCKFCNREAATLNSNSQHELYCKANPDRKIKKPSMGMLGKNGANQYSYGATMSASTKEKISIASRNIRWTAEQKSEHSKRMKRAVENYPESYTSSNRGRTKQIIYKGIKFQGTWELAFYQWCESNNVDCNRNSEGFAYEWNGSRTYFPDFYLPVYDSYVEVKGFKTDRDDAKWQQFPKKLLIVDKKDIDAIKKNCYNITC